MPWRLIQFIVLFAVLLLFVVFNLENKCDISFGFKVINDFPVYLTVFFAFFAGMLCVIPFMLGVKSRKKEKPVKEKGLLSKNQDKKSDDLNLTDKNHYGID